MISVVASWDSQTGQSQIHLVVDHSSLPGEERRKQIQDTVQQLESDLNPERFEVICSISRSLDEFRQTDSRFFQTPYSG